MDKKKHINFISIYIIATKCSKIERKSSEVLCAEIKNKFINCNLIVYVIAIVIVNI